MGIVDWLLGVFAALGGALGGGQVLVTVATDPATLPTVVAVAMIAGISMMAGHSGILAINGIGGVRFFAAWVLTGVQTVILYLIQAGVIIALGALVFAHSPAPAAVARSVMLSAAPLALGFLILIPYAGPLIARGLQLWSFLIMLQLLQIVYGIGLAGAFLVAITSWLVMHILGRLLAVPLDRLLRVAWGAVTGRPTLFSARDVLAGHPLVEAEGRGD